MKRVISFLLSFVIVFSTIGLNSVTAKAEYTVEHTNYSTTQYVIGESANLTEEQLAEQKNFATEAVKFLISNLIKHGDDCARLIAEHYGDDVAKYFLKYHTKIAKSLTPLLQWADIPKNAVVDAVYRGVIAGGGTNHVATLVSHAVEIVWELFIF